MTRPSTTTRIDRPEDNRFHHPIRDTFEVRNGRILRAADAALGGELAAHAEIAQRARA